MADPKPLTFVCTNCGAHGSPEQFAVDADSKRYAQLLAEMPAPVASAVIRYLTLFNPPRRKLTAPRARKLIEELAPMIRDRQASRDGRSFEAPHDAWGSAIDELLGQRDRLDLPLTSHGLLLAILMRHADRAGRHAETEREAQRQRDSQARASHLGDQAERIGDVMRQRSLGPGQRADETQAEYFARIRRETDQRERRER